MNFRTSRRGGLQRLLLAGAIGLTTLSAPAFSAPTPVKGGTISVATIGEPPTLDPMSSTADLVGILTQHFFETLYTFDAQWNLTPLLADKMPEISADGLVYTIPLRQGITFHDGSKMDSSDVLASLKRWTETATRGKGAAKVISSIEAPDANTIRITLKQPYSPLTALLAMNNAAAVIMPKGKIAPVLTEIVGTGPYQLKARVPDQYIQLVRFDGYKQREGEPGGYGGARKQYLDEIRFVPVSNANTRTEAAVAGQFDYVDSLPVESLDKLKGGRSDPVMLKPFGWPRLVLNTKQGIMSNLAVRQAVQLALNEEDMLFAAFGNKEFYSSTATCTPRATLGHVAGRQGLQQGRHRRRQKAAGRRQRRRQEDPHPDQPAVRVPLQDGAGRRRVPEGRRLHGGHAGGGLGHADAAPPGSGRVGHLHHPQRVPARTRPDRLPSRTRRAGGTRRAAPGHGRVQPGAHPGRTRQALGRRAAGRV